jgi:DnaJ domain
MAVDASAYATLGLDPGADAATIEQAYKRLIKAYHPDREGGDGRRAADITRAYRDIRVERNLRDPLELNDDWPVAPSEGRAWVVVASFLAAAVGLLLLVEDLLANGATAGSDLVADHLKTIPAGADPMDEPLHLGAIDTAMQKALQLARTRDEMALASASRDCHHRLRNDPSLAQLDRCAAFDDAVVQLEGRDPLRDQGPFGELAVTGRLWSGATALSDDYVAIDGRLDRIRLRVELALAPASPAKAPANRS